MSDFCQNSYSTPDLLRISPLAMWWNAVGVAERQSMISLQWLSSFAECGASRCSHGCPRMRLGWNMGTYTREWPRGSKGSTSEGAEPYSTFCITSHKNSPFSKMHDTCPLVVLSTLPAWVTFCTMQSHCFFYLEYVSSGHPFWDKKCWCLNSQYVYLTDPS